LSVFPDRLVREPCSGLSDPGARARHAYVCPYNASLNAKACWRRLVSQASSGDSPGASRRAIRREPMTEARPALRFSHRQAQHALEARYATTRPGDAGNPVLAAAPAVDAHMAASVLLDRNATAGAMRRLHRRQIPNFQIARVKKRLAGRCQKNAVSSFHAPCLARRQLWGLGLVE
jgi:hypothetical protein